MANSDEKPVPVVYCNAASVSMSPFDITLTLGRSQPSIEGVDHTSQPPQLQCVVHMSPLHAKVFLRALEQSIDTYEQLVAPLPEWDATRWPKILEEYTAHARPE